MKKCNYKLHQMKCIDSDVLCKQWKYSQTNKRTMMERRVSSSLE